MAEHVKELMDVAQQAVELCRAAGAEGVEVIARGGAELTTKVRLGEPELVKEAQSKALGLRVFVDHKAAVTFTSDFTPDGLKSFAESGVKLAQFAQADELNEVPENAVACDSFPELELWDPEVPKLDAAWGIELATRAEDAARKHDKRITTTDGATFGRTIGGVAFANSNGFTGGYQGSQVMFYVQPIADDADGKKRNGVWWSASRRVSGLDSAEEVGRIATERTVAMLGARKVESGQVPCVFEPSAGKSLLDDLFAVANGGAFYRKASYLIGKEGETIASPLITVYDDPLIKGAAGSRPFDGDGLKTQKNVVVDKGILKTILCDTYSARKLSRQSTASAGRGVGGSPGPTTSNWILESGETSPEEIIGSTKRGLYVTNMMGFGFNPVTGDFSQGASGFWIEDGKKTFPVTEVTISTNFLDLWKNIDAVGNDPDRRGSTVCPTLRVSSMILAGT